MIYDALRHGRQISFLLRRNPLNDAVTKDASFAGFDFFWEDGQPAQMNLARLCGIGVRQVFGEQLPGEGSFLVQFYLIPINDPYSPRLAVPRRLKPRRMYFQRRGPMAALHLANGICTDIAFHQDEDPRAIRWVGLNEMSDGQRQWADFVAICDGQVGPISSINF